MKGGEEKTALLVIDFQNDFYPGAPGSQVDGKASLPCPGGGPIHQNVNTLTEYGKTKGWMLIATKDAHPKDHMSFAVNNSAEPFSMKTLTVNGKEIQQMMWPVHCVPGTPGAEFCKEFVAGEYKTFEKGKNREIDSYSGFGDGFSGTPGGVKSMEDTGLNKFLDENGITHVIVCGIATDVCVKHTCDDALAYGKSVTLVEDACAGTAMGHDSALTEFKNRKVEKFKVVKTSDLK